MSSAPHALLVDARTVVSSSVQLVLPLADLVVPERVEGASIQERFEAFHALNPWVYDAYVELARDWAARGGKRLGIGMLTEVLRWHYARQTNGDKFKINDNYRSRYVRMLIAEHPDLADLFRTRELRTP